jgi:hypothetical protein
LALVGAVCVGVAPAHPLAVRAWNRAESSRMLPQPPMRVWYAVGIAALGFAAGRSVRIRRK